ncbi:glycosyltransferase family 8 protein [Sphingobacterium tabacisoli]|uniref:Glycosyltransferase family 8 protein n=1 Tax=Sphingobacterium tabacisoli TaxID=2044855 RepID=A0ABW5L7N3_9SPHI|nr:glycosyltransferase family 8 protein [Sphingobacterium tabacisoli]
MVDRVPIVMALTPSYLIPTSVCIVSMLASSDEKDCFDIILLLTEDLTVGEKSALQLLAPERINFEFLIMSDMDLDIYVDEKFTIAASYRLLIPDLLPELERVIYVDSDMIIRQNIAKLYREVDLSDHYLAGVYEATLDFQEEYIKGIGCEPGKYFNSGFLMMNLTKLREDDMVSKFLKYAKNDQFQFPDQDVLNQLCNDKFLPLAPVYNSIRTFFIEDYKGDFVRYYSEKDWDDVKVCGTVHYTGPKPWNSFSVMFDLWWEYYRKLPKELKAFSEVSKLLSSFSRVYKISMVKSTVSRVKALLK